MSTELVDKLTPVTKPELVEALWYGWIHVFGEEPKKESIWILMSQWALETGWGKFMHNYNLGNAKSREGDGYDYSYFKCNEIIRRADAVALQNAAPQTAKITSYRNDGKCIIWFYPKHPGCRFRAFKTLLEGAIDHISLVYKRFNKSWSALLSGDPERYAIALKSQSYFTADLHTPSKTGYADVLISLFNTVKNIEIDYSKFVPMEEKNDELSDEQKDRLANLITITTQEVVDNYLETLYAHRDSESHE